MTTSRKAVNPKWGESKEIVGWREWVSLDGLGISKIKAKIDTGARTSSLHAVGLRFYTDNGVQYVSFKVHPQQRSAKETIEASSPIHEFRTVRSSNGHQSKRPVIITQVKMGDLAWDIELTLANRDDMGFRMLIGREGIRGRLLVDSGKSYLTSK